MKRKIAIKQSHVIVTIAVVILFLVFLLCGISQKKVFADIKNSISHYNLLPTGLPVRLKIPSISLDVSVEHVGVTQSGEMDTPKHIEDVGWFDLGVVPGEIGSAVIDGHYGWKNNRPVAFENLSKVKIGETISVENDKGVITTFLVRAIKQYDVEADTAGIFTSNDGKSHLNLITCTGIWDNIEKRYANRLVVFTDREETQ